MMASRVWAWGSAAAVLLVCAGCRVDHGSAVAENRTFSREMIGAIEGRSLDGMMERVWRSPDVLFVGPGGEVARGWDRIRPIEEEFLASFESARIEIEDETYAVAGDTVVAVLTLRGRLTLAGGGVETIRLRLSDVRRRDGGRWVTIYNHSHILEHAVPDGR